MRQFLCAFLAGCMVFLAWGADTASTAKKKTTTTTKKKTTVAAHKAAPSKAGATAHKTTTSSTSVRKGVTKKAPAKKTASWRSRQMAPTPERYQEIQNALVAKGYLKSEDAHGSWNENSVDALKRFQTEQNLESTGKINSLSLIALGLGPKHDAPVKPAENPQ
jgi:hypothetical protein